MIRANFKDRTVMANGCKVRLSPMKWLIVITVWMRGRINTVHMQDIIWSDDPEGGPSWDSLAVQQCYINRLLQPLGCRIATRAGMLELEALK